MITESNSDLCRKWLLLSVCALAVSGFLSIVIIVLRFPFLTKFFSEANKFFDISLVVHVNLSVLVWMCSITLILVSFLINNIKYLRYFKALYYISLFGTVCMICSIFVSETIAFKNNYVPVLNNRLFLIGLALFLISVLLYSILTLKESNRYSSIILFGAYNTSIMMTIVFVCFFLTLKSLYVLHSRDTLMFYEILFWGGGHLLQFVFSQVLIIIYLLMFEIDERSAKLTSYIKIILFSNALLVVFVPVIYFFYEVDSPILVNFFTWHMRIAGSLIPISLVLFAVFNIKIFFLKDNRPLLCSILTFLYGGLLGLLAVEGNVTIPAHYHGSIVGMTIAFMGFIYWLLPRLNLGKVQSGHINFQIYFYTTGQFLHITGLELLGGYGALRKVAYLPSIASVFVKILFITGGIMAVIGGALFVILVLNKIVRNSDILTVFYGPNK